MPWNDLTGKRFGKLTVTKFDHQSQARLNFYECKCDCGNTIIARSSFLKKGITKSCGCYVEAVADQQPASAPVVIGQKVRFDPFYDITGFASEDFRGGRVRGTVVYVNYPHKWFSVEYGKPKARTSFKFCDIGKFVNLL